MIDRINSNANIQSMLQTLKAYQNEAAGAPAGTSGVNTDSTGFLQAMQKTVNKVNDLQNNAQALSSAYERGEDVPLTDVVLGMQKSSLAFEATLQVRNKVLKAYDDIMSMPV